MKNLTRILKINSSARREDSVTRNLTDAIISHVSESAPVQVIERDVSEGLPFINEAWVGANFTPAEMRTSAQVAALSKSDELIQEIVDADVLVIGAPIYNFGVSATFKAWIDQIARAGVTFKYTENGPIGLLTGKKAIVAIASGGTQSGSDIDFATPYIRHVMGFIGITDVQFIVADALGQEAEEKIASALLNVKQLEAGGVQ